MYIFSTLFEVFYCFNINQKSWSGFECCYSIWLVATSWQEPKIFHFTRIGTARQSKQYKFRIYLIDQSFWEISVVYHILLQRVCKLFQTTFFKLLLCIIFFFQIWQIVIHEAFFVCKLLFPKTFFWKLSFLKACLLNVFWTNFANWPSGQHFTNNGSRSKLYKMEFTFGPIFSSLFLLFCC